ncbi:MAG: hypothetical protein F6J86_06690 [Symploca sp. SIO1B1]|nr:hypothetical protein [Symploca sp. SIO1B1]
MKNQRDFYQSWSEVLEDIKQNPQAYLDLLKCQTEFSPLTQESKPTKAKRAKRFKLLKEVKHLLWTDHAKLYGRHYATPSLQKRAAIVATIISAATAINTVSFFPLIRMAFLNLGSIGTGLSLVVTILVLIASNESGTVAATNHPKNRTWSIMGFITFALINVCLTIVAAPGIELLNGQRTLAELKADELISPIIKERKNLYASAKQRRQEKIERKKQECQKLNEEITALGRNHPDRNRLILRAQGRYQDRNLDRSKIAVEDLPICQQVAALETESAEYTRQATENLELVLVELAKGKQTFLREQYPETYKNHFNEKGEIRDNNEAVRLAISNFNQKLASGEWSSLGFSLSFFALSFVTSGGAIIVVFAYAWSKPAIQSWNPVLGRMREEIFLGIDQGLARASTTGLIAYQKKTNLKSLPGTIDPTSQQQWKISQDRYFLWRCAAAMRQSGICTFPQFTRFIERNPEGERLLSLPVSIEDETQNRLIWTDQPDIAISYLHGQTSLICYNIATLSRSLHVPEIFGEFSPKKAAQALTQEIHRLQGIVETIEQTFPFTSAGKSSSLLDDLHYAGEYIRYQLEDAFEEENNQNQLLKQLDQKQLRTYLIQIEHLSLELSNCLTKQLEAGIVAPYLPG